MEQYVSFKRCSWVPAKCNILMWRAGLDRIPTRQALCRRNIRINSDECGLCGEGVDLVDHIFTACEYSLCGWARLPPLYAFTFKDIMDFHKSIPGNKKVKETVRGLMFVACWCIWKARNANIFSNWNGNSGEIFEEVRSLGFLWLKSRSKHRNLDWRKWCNFTLYTL
ncbi:uncharacterized protein LOC110924227 [Helianthus annuus]|uniref:uncharacterized protein LOC110924227 n=1 Tax=Helianthus annuus TaxID=4232 RepID=UPI000B8EFA47|nr:uncharacterized protein LOC110924227 [Helianthus annuus]